MNAAQEGGESLAARKKSGQGLAAGLLRQLLADESDAIIAIDAHRRLVLFSTAAEELFGYRAEEVLGGPLDTLIPEHARRAHSAWVDGFAGGTVSRRRMSDRSEVTGRRKDGSKFSAEVTISKSVIDGRLVMAATIRKATPPSLADRERELATQFAETMAEHAADGVLIVDGDLRTVFASKSFSRLSGYDPTQHSSESPIDLVHHEDRASFGLMANYVARHPGASARQEVRLARRGGTWLWVEARITNLSHDPAIGGMLVSVRDITERRRAQELLLHRSRHDRTTGLADRDALLSCVDELASGERGGGCFSVFCLDLDRFRSVNEALGRAAGDEALRGVAARLKAERCGSGVVARLGSDEFALVCDEAATAGAALRVAGRIRAAFSRPLTVGDMELFITASIGVALSRPGASGDTLLAQAEAAMREAKLAGGDRFVLGDPNVGADALARVQLDTQLRRAIAENQLIAHFQPIVRLEDNAVATREALLRWQHPERGLLGPADFLPYAEKSGLIEPIGRQILLKACHVASTHAAIARSPVGVAVNASARELSSGFLENVERSLDSSGLDANLLTIELTETFLMANVEELRPLLDGLRALGVRLSIDDFGTGYSSLAYLKRLPVETIKIDRSFISGIATDPDDLAIAAAIVSMAHTIGLAVVAEGIETQAQLECLAALGCDFGQGFLLGVPEPDGHWPSGTPKPH